VHVYLFPTCEAVQEVFGKRYAGVALTPFHAVVVPFEVRPLAEWLRHELAHLFSDRWNPLAPPLLQEGLSTWLRGSERGSPIAGPAAILLRQAGYRLRRMLGRKFFFREENHLAWYALAGSFSGFLIGRFGWDAFRRLYRGVAGARKFDLKLKE